jgi:hypothetical protein
MKTEIILVLAIAAAAWLGWYSWTNASQLNSLRTPSRVRREDWHRCNGDAPGLFAHIGPVFDILSAFDKFFENACARMRR